jgi:hypothetical protein
MLGRGDVQPGEGVLLANWVLDVGTNDEAEELLTNLTCGCG